MATVSNTPRPGYVWDSTDNVWYPIGVGAHQHTNAADTPAVMPYSTYAAAGKNKIINGDFGIWQRGTSFTASTAEYTADRWQKWTGSTAITVSRQSSGLTGIQYCARFQRNSGSTATAGYDYWHSLETSASSPLAGQTVTLSFYARKGADYSPTSSLLSVKLFTGIGTDQNLNVGGFTGASAIINTTATLTTSWQRFTYTASVGSTATQLGINFQMSTTGTAGTNDYYEVTGVQLEAGSTVTAFQTATGNPASELAACQRYYWRFTATAGGANYLCLGRTTTQVDVEIQHPVQMRTSPTALEYGGTTDVSDINVAGYNTTSLSFANASVLFASIRANIGQASLAQGKTYVFGVQANAYYGFSAEL